MKLKTIYLVLCVLGLVLPYWQFVPWVLANGLNMPLFFRQLFANRIGGFFGMDVLVSAVALLVFTRREGARLGARAVVATHRGAHRWRLSWVAAVSVSARTDAGARPGTTEHGRSMNANCGLISPILRSAADRKDVPELPPDPRDTTAPPAADVACVFPLPFPKLNRRLWKRAVRIGAGEAEHYCECKAFVDPFAKKHAELLIEKAIKDPSLTVEDLGASLGLSETCVRKTLNSAGIKLAKRGQKFMGLIPDADLIAANERYRREQPKPQPSNREKTRILIEVVTEDSSLTVQELADASDMSPSWVRKTLRAAGLMTPAKPRKSGQLLLAETDNATQTLKGDYT
jgi:AraC-like DNA-binding protein